MSRCQRVVAGLCVGVVGMLLAAGPGAAGEAKVTRFARFQVEKKAVWGIVEGDRVRQIDAEPFRPWKPTDTTFPLAEVKLMVPTRPGCKVLALAGNYKSHLGDKGAPANPEVFFKIPSCLIAQGEKIVIPPGTAQVDHEGEMVIVVGKRARDVAPGKALDCVLGVTCGNDVSARDWQKNDVQWWRAKGSDTFGPCGPVIVSGIKYDDLQLTVRVNGEVRQQQRTSDLIFGVAAIVSFISRHVTLEPGDLIFTGTPGTTTQLKPGDVVEVELEGVGVLGNPVAARPERPKGAKKQAKP